MKIGMILAAMSSSAALGAVFPIGNYTCTGKVLDWNGGLIKAEDGVSVMAVAEDGRILAKSAVFDYVEPAEGDGYNYRLTIPMASAASADCAVFDQTLSLVAVSAEATYQTASNRMFRVGSPFTRTSANIKLATDADHDGIPDQYVAELSPWMEAYGYKMYDPDADWDGDGRSNRDEYNSGTNPFDPSDAFKLTFLSSHSGQSLPVQGDNGYTFAVGLETVGGRTYTVQGAAALDGDKASWDGERFKIDRTENEPTKASYTEAESVAARTFYLMPVGDQHFWKVLVKPVE